jgi:F0F1-type ATP synthase membrane subunit b/b'
VAVSFFVFIGVLVYLGIHKKVASALDARALRISKELEEARRLREEAEKLLVDYRRKLGDVVTEVDNIIALAASQAEILAVETRQSLKEHVERRIKLAEEKIARAEIEAVRELRERCGRRSDRSSAKYDRCQAHARSSQEARLREHQGAQDLAAVTTACPAPLEASTWPSLVGAENLADIVELLLAQARIVKRT